MKECIDDKVKFLRHCDNIIIQHYYRKPPFATDDKGNVQNVV